MALALADIQRLTLELNEQRQREVLRARIKQGVTVDREQYPVEQELIDRTDFTDAS